MSLTFFYSETGETDTTITSDDFDVRLLIYLLRTLAKIEIGDVYPVPCDKKVSAMLSRIKFIRNEITQSFEGKLSEDRFIQCWDDIVQVKFHFMLCFMFLAFYCAFSYAVPRKQKRYRIMLLFSFGLFQNIIKRINIIQLINICNKHFRQIYFKLSVV